MKKLKIFFSQQWMLLLTFDAAEGPAEAHGQAEDEEHRRAAQRQDHHHAGSCCDNHNNDHSDDTATHSNTTTHSQQHKACNLLGLETRGEVRMAGEGRYRIASKRPQSSGRQEKKKKRTEKGRGHAVTGCDMQGRTEKVKNLNMQ